MSSQQEVDAELQLTPPTESMADMESRHEQEITVYGIKARAAVKAAKKSERVALETEMLQGEYDLKAKHSEEMDLLEQQIVKFGEYKGENLATSESGIIASQPEDDKEEGLSKKEKAKRKKDKKANKEREKEQVRADIISANAGVVSARDVELQVIEKELNKDGMVIKLIASDGQCLYRALTDQLHLRPSVDDGSHPGMFSFSFDANAGADSSHNSALNVKQLRQAVAAELHAHSEQYKPFIGLDGDEFEAYCNKVAAYDSAEWGGQVEIQAACACLQRDIWIYSADAHTPILKMGNYNAQPPLRISYHRQYYALGEHYNSVIDTVV